MFSGRLSRQNFIFGSLLILILIIPIGIVASVALVSLSDARQKAADAQLQAQMQEAQMNQVLDQNQSGVSPVSTTTQP